MSRGENFLDEEKYALVELVEKYSYVIECKKTDATTNKDKKQAWLKLTGEFNNDRYILKSDEQLLNCWKTLKKNAKEYSAKIRKENYATGGGPRKVKENSLYDAVLRIITVAAGGSTNRFDCDVLEGNAADLLKETGGHSTPSQVWQNLMAFEGINTWKDYKPRDLKSSLNDVLTANVELVKMPPKQPLGMHNDSKKNSASKDAEDSGVSMECKLNCRKSVSGTPNDPIRSAGHPKDNRNENKPLDENTSDLFSLYRQKVELEKQLLQKQITNEDLRTFFLRQRNLTSFGNSASPPSSLLSARSDDDDKEGY